jgi:NADH:ubiquinone oxidoreductase subunit K
MVEESWSSEERQARRMMFYAAIVMLVSINLALDLALHHFGRDFGLVRATVFLISVVGSPFAGHAIGCLIMPATFRAAQENSDHDRARRMEAKT